MTTRKDVLLALTKGANIRDDQLESFAFSLSGDNIPAQIYELVIKLCEKEILTTTEAVEILRR